VNVISYALIEHLSSFQSSNAIIFANFKLSCGSSGVSANKFIEGGGSVSMTADYQIIFQCFSLDAVDGNLTYTRISQSLSAGILSNNMTRLIRKYAVLYNVPGLSTSGSTTPITLSPPVERGKYSEETQQQSSSKSGLSVAVTAGIVIGVLVFICFVLVAVYIVSVHRSIVRKYSVVDFTTSYPEAEGRVSIAGDVLNEARNSLSDNSSNRENESNNNNIESYSRGSFGVMSDEIRQSISPFSDHSKADTENGRESMFARFIGNYSSGSKSTGSIWSFMSSNSASSNKISPVITPSIGTASTINKTTTSRVTTHIGASIKQSNSNNTSVLAGKSSRYTKESTDIETSEVMSPQQQNVIEHNLISLSTTDLSNETRDLETITGDETIKLLKYWGLIKFKSQFIENGINGSVLVCISSLDDLKDCSIYLPGPMARSFLKSIIKFKDTGVPVRLLL